MEFGILGPLAVWQDGREIELGAAKQRALLAVLLLHAGEVMPTGRLVDALWGETPPATAVKALQVYVSQLRKTLGGGVVETRQLGYVVEVAEGALDLQRFERLLADGRRLLGEGSPREAGETLRDALALWRGEPLADFRYDGFATNEIARLEELRLIALELRLEADITAGRDAESVPELETLVHEHPLRERLRELLMLALYHSGRQADALAVMQDARATLRDELGLDPGASLQQLEKAILNQDPSLDIPVAAPPASPKPPPRGDAPVVDGAETRKTVTILFANVVAYAEPEGRLDPEALLHVMERFFEPAAAAIHQHGGTVEKLAGDEVVAVFGVPVVREDDALRAVRAAQALRDCAAAVEAELASGVKLQIRTGLDTGEVLAGQASVTGEPLTLGKRLAQAAAPGEILLGALTHELVAHAVATTARAPLELPGGRGSLAPFRLELVDAEASTRAPRDDIPFVGRERELAQLRGVYRNVAAGNGARHVTVVGEPGIGKSRLVRKLLDELEGEATILIGRCPPYGEGITFWPLRELLRQAGRDESELDGPTHETFAAIRHVFVELAGEQPVVAVFDDVHWAEPTFLDLLEDLAARLGPSPVLLLCLGRPELAKQRPGWLEGAALELEPLDRPDADALLEALSAPVAVRAAIADTAEGNPLFVEQLTAIAGEHGAAVGMPSSLRGVLHERLDRLDPAQRAVLERAAVAGRSFSLVTVLDLTPTEDRDGAHAALLALVRQRLVRPDALGPEDGYRFQHALIRDAAYDGIPKRGRIELHERVAARLETQSADDAIIGYHLEQAVLFGRELGRPDPELGARTAGLLQTAGLEAFRRTDVRAAISLYERARALVADDDGMVPALLTSLAEARVKLGDSAGAERDADEAIEAARLRGDHHAELRALIERQIARSFAGPVSAVESLELAREATEDFERLGDDVGLAKAWYLKAHADSVAGRVGDATEAVELALFHARRAKAIEMFNTASTTLHSLVVWGRTPVPEAIVRVEGLMEAPEFDRAARAMAASSLAALLAMDGSFERARSVLADAVATNDDLGLRHRRALTSRMGAVIELLAEDAAAAEAELRAALDELGGRGTEYDAALRVFLAEVVYSLERLDEVEPLLQAAASIEGNLELDVRRRSIRSRLLATRGELEEAERLVAEALALSDGTEEPVVRVSALTAAADVASIQGRTAEARKLLEEALQIMKAKGNVAAVRSLEEALREPVP